MTLRNCLVFLPACLLLACAPPAEEVDPDSLSITDLAMSVDSSVDGVDAEAEEGESTDVLADLETEGGEPVAPDRAGRREIVRRLVTNLAQDEPCALRGVVAGRYRSIEDAIADGAIAGRAFRRGEGLVARGAGTYVAGDEPGGSWAMVWENMDGDTGDASGTYAPRDPAAEVPVGTFEGAWEAADGPGYGNMAGIWHPTQDGRGLFVGYYSNCRFAPVHLD